MLFPDHPYLLESSFETIATLLKTNGYVSKLLLAVVALTIRLFDGEER